MKNWSNQKQLLAALFIIISAVPTMTTATVDKKSVTVSFADLDLSKEAGVEVLYSRLKFAARHACGDIQNARDISMRQIGKQCYNEALSGAVQSINNEQLYDLHAQ